MFLLKNLSKRKQEKCCGSGSVRIQNFMSDPDPLFEGMVSELNKNIYKINRTIKKFMIIANVIYEVKIKILFKSTGTVI
jgi:hypothetical protein